MFFLRWYTTRPTADSHVCQCETVGRNAASATVPTIFASSTHLNNVPKSRVFFAWMMIISMDIGELNAVASVPDGRIHRPGTHQGRRKPQLIAQREMFWTELDHALSILSCWIEDSSCSTGGQR
jgi:hypothetical protein